MPFAYPVAGYEPLEDPPVLALKQSSYLLGALCRVVSLLDRQPGSPQLSVANDASCVLAASYAFAYLKPLLKSRYVVRARLLPLMHTLRVAGGKPGLVLAAKFGGGVGFLSIYTPPFLLPFFFCLRPKTSVCTCF